MFVLSQLINIRGITGSHRNRAIYRLSRPTGAEINKEMLLPSVSPTKFNSQTLQKKNLSKLNEDSMQKKLQPERNCLWSIVKSASQRNNEESREEHKLICFHFMHHLQYPCERGRFLRRLASIPGAARMLVSAHHGRKNTRERLKKKKRKRMMVERRAI